MVEFSSARNNVQPSDSGFYNFIARFEFPFPVVHRFQNIRPPPLPNSLPPFYTINSGCTVGYIPYLHIMISRNMIRQCQTAKSALSIRSISNRAFPATRPAYLQPLSQSIKPFPPRLLRRYSSTESEGADPKKESASEKNGNEKKPEDAEELVKKELEAAKKEIVDLKV